MVPPQHHQQQPQPGAMGTMYHHQQSLLMEHQETTQTLDLSVTRPMTEAKAREHQTTFTEYRFVLDDEVQDFTGRNTTKVPNWERVKRIPVNCFTKEATLNQIKKLEKAGSVGDKKRLLPSKLVEHLDNTAAGLLAGLDFNIRHYFEAKLVQIDIQPDGDDDWCSSEDVNHRDRRKGHDYRDYHTKGSKNSHNKLPPISFLDVLLPGPLPAQAKKSRARRNSHSHGSSHGGYDHNRNKSHSGEKYKKAIGQSLLLGPRSSVTAYYITKPTSAANALKLWEWNQQAPNRQQQWQQQWQQPWPQPAYHQEQSRQDQLPFIQLNQQEGANQARQPPAQFVREEHQARPEARNGNSNGNGGANGNGNGNKQAKPNANNVNNSNSNNHNSGSGSSSNNNNRSQSRSNVKKQTEDRGRAQSAQRPGAPQDQSRDGVRSQSHSGDKKINNASPNANANMAKGKGGESKGGRVLAPSPPTSRYSMTSSEEADHSSSGVDSESDSSGDNRRRPQTNARMRQKSRPPARGGFHVEAWGPGAGPEHFGKMPDHVPPHLMRRFAEHRISEPAFRPRIDLESAYEAGRAYELGRADAREDQDRGRQRERDLAMQYNQYQQQHSYTHSLTTPPGYHRTPSPTHYPRDVDPEVMPVRYIRVSGVENGHAEPDDAWSSDDCQPHLDHHARLGRRPPPPPSFLPLSRRRGGIPDDVNMHARRDVPVAIPVDVVTGDERKEMEREIAERRKYDECERERRGSVYHSGLDTSVPTSRAGLRVGAWPRSCERRRSASARRAATRHGEEESAGYEQDIYADCSDCEEAGYRSSRFAPQQVSPLRGDSHSHGY